MPSSPFRLRKGLIYWSRFLTVLAPEKTRSQSRKNIRLSTIVFKTRRLVMSFSSRCTRALFLNRWVTCRRSMISRSEPSRLGRCMLIEFTGLRNNSYNRHSASAGCKPERACERKQQHSQSEHDDHMMMRLFASSSLALRFIRILRRDLAN